MIKIFPTIQIKELDAYTIENEPIASIDLMAVSYTHLDVYKRQGQRRLISSDKVMWYMGLFIVYGLLSVRRG